MPAFLQGNYGIRHELFIIIIASKTHPKKKKITQNKSMNKKKKIANLHTYMAILTNIKLDYSSANSIYYCT